MLKNYIKFTLFTIILVIGILISPNLLLAFSDVDENSSHYPAIMKLTEDGIINGYEDGTFKGGNTLQRRHGAKLLYNALTHQGILDKELQPENIADILSTHYDDVNAENVYAKEIASLTPDIFKGNNRKFEPLKSMNREQMATVIVRAFELEDLGTNPGINLSNVSESHRANVKVLAQHGITDQLADFRPREPVTRAQFATFLYRAMYGFKTIVNTSFYDIDFKTFLEIQANRSPKVDGAGRFVASKELVEYYANSNNFTQGSAEFLQFLMLSKTAGLDAKELNEKVLKNKGILDGKGAAFIEAGKQNNINEVYLIAHALHETGNGTSTLAKGVEVNGKTVYNMYGIAAYDDTPVESGSKYAYEQGWFTPEAAIIGGAQFIGSRYISQGQDTLYKMRWNPDNPGVHQYATHVSWAVNQTRRIKEIYDLLDTYVLIYDVPKYKNQPSSSPEPSGEARYAIDTSKAGLIGEVTGDKLNFRTYPSTAVYSNIIRQLTKGTTVEIIGENGGWYKVRVGKEEGWVSGTYINISNGLKIVNISTTLNVRSGPNTTSSILGSLKNNEIVIGIKDKNGNFIKENGWYKIKYKNGEAWVSGQYVKEI